MIHLLKEVGRGKRGARDLSYEEAIQAAESILGLQASPAQIGAFLMAERIKMESVEELQAFVKTARKAAHRHPMQGGIDCAAPYDGRKSSFIASIATAFILAAAGLPVTLHGAAALPPKWGVTLSDVFMSAGIHAKALQRDSCIQAAEKTGVLYVHAEEWCPPLKQLRPIREELGMRTVLNTVEKLIDYSSSPFLSFGVFHNTVFDRMTRLMEQLGYQQSMIIQGSEGSDELYIHRPTRTCRMEHGQAVLQMIDPEAFGLDTPVPEREWSAPLQAETTDAVLRGEADMAFIHQVLLNGGVRLHLAGRVLSIEEGIYTCKAVLESGEPYKLYTTWLKMLKKEPQAV
ncbi:anthranilate phosphoribosyltransferase [Paenibacillus lemnae]|uniref:Anthranilate phosphoribosyltransferase n=1 Tax=Paenibacillus lemnae TaxID=1330551 RepID=A0A848M510_PAELE|nr:anthranilate phosphoribosyltransferase [Paenibacillus lemnae]NMO95845.1 anthranilate phosphoribosyltransferase [Paenibacillus lemnae]